MHELSIAVNIVEAASQRAAEAGAEKVSTVHLKVGALSGVVHDALTFSFDIATDGTLLEGAALEIEAVPAVAFCPQCEAEKTLRHGYRRCPDCGAPTPKLLRGQELEITAIEIHEPEESP